nr:MAG TPA: hypothetical protein [Caudoviricetes sp.]
MKLHHLGAQVPCTKSPFFKPCISLHILFLKPFSLPVLR